MSIFKIQHKLIAEETGYVTVHYGKHSDFAVVVGGQVAVEDSVMKYPSFSQSYKLEEIVNAQDLLDELEGDYLVQVTADNRGIEEVNGKYKFNF